MPDRSTPTGTPELDALLAVLDAVNVVIGCSSDDGNGDRHRAALLALVLIDYRAVRTVAGR